MFDLTPVAVRLVDRYSDGEEIDHFTFEPVAVEGVLPSVANPGPGKSRSVLYADGSGQG